MVSVDILTLQILKSLRFRICLITITSLALLNKMHQFGDNNIAYGGISSPFTEFFYCCYSLGNTVITKLMGNPPELNLSYEQGRINEVIYFHKLDILLRVRLP